MNWCDGAEAYPSNREARLVTIWSLCSLLHDSMLQFALSREGMDRLAQVVSVSASFGECSSTHDELGR